MTCDGITGGYYVPKEPPKTGTVKTAGTTPSTVGTANRNNVSGSAIGDALLHYGQNTTAAASSAPTTSADPTTPAAPDNVSGRANKTIMGRINGMIDRLSGGDAEKAKQIKEKVLPDAVDSNGNTLNHNTDELISAHESLQQAQDAVK